VATAAGNAVFDYLESHKLFERVAPAGETLRKSLSCLENHPHIGQVRGLGLLMGVEFVKDKATHEPFPKEAGVADKIRQAAFEKNVLLYPGQGTVDGVRGDHVLLAPPFIIEARECEQIADSLQNALKTVFPA
jgi:adenosylmethionine-8-amino-7-oxononanoate aminotransferase